MATRKHLDLPLDDDVNISNKGISGKALLGFGGLILAGVLGWRALTPEVMTPTLPTRTPMLSQEYEVRFWAEDGSEAKSDRGGSGYLEPGNPS